MKSLYAACKAAALACAALCLAAAAGGAALAQRGREIDVARREEHMRRQAAEHERNNQKRDLDPADDAAAHRRAQAATAQVRQDFESLQAGYNRIVLAFSRKRAVGPDDSLAAAVAEVNKCALRLRHNLALPRPKGDAEQKPRPVPAAADNPLASLGKLLHSFLTNPLFESPGVLDVGQAERAARDLERIIELSEGISRDGLKPAAAKKP